MGCQVSFCVSGFSHFRLILRRCLGRVFEGFLDARKVVGSVSALELGLLPFHEVGMCLDEVGLKGCPEIVILVPPGPTVFRLMACLSHQSICDAY